jgi:large subunit ribosomal protein L14
MGTRRKTARKKVTKPKITAGLCNGSRILITDNSGAKEVFLVSVKGSKTSKGRSPSAGVGDLLNVSVRKGTKELRKKLAPAILVRQKKEYKRPDGTRIKFEDNAVIICKDDKGNPKGTVIKGPVAKEAAERWPGISKIASIIV